MTSESKQYETLTITVRIKSPVYLNLHQIIKSLKAKILKKDNINFQGYLYLVYLFF